MVEKAFQLWCQWFWCPYRCAVFPFVVVFLQIAVFLSVD